MANFNFNKVTLAGRLTADVDLKQTTNGLSVCSFTLAIARKSNREETDFIKCTAWRKTAEFISQYFGKGSSLCVTGSIQNRNWTDNNGNKRVDTEVLVEEAYFVDSKAENDATLNKPRFEEINADEDLPF